MLWSFVLKQLSKEAVELKMTTNKLQQEAEKQVFQLKSKVISLLLFNVGLHDNERGLVTVKELLLFNPGLKGQETPRDVKETLHIGNKKMC